MISIWSAGFTLEDRSITTSSRERNTAWQGAVSWPSRLLLSPMSTFTFAKTHGGQKTPNRERLRAYYYLDYMHVMQNILKLRPHRNFFLHVGYM